MDRDTLEFMIGNFRRDSRMAWNYERNRARWRISAPIHAVFGTADPLTENYAELYRRWSEVSGEVYLHEVEGGHHYFVGEAPDAVADILGQARARSEAS